MKARIEDLLTAKIIWQKEDGDGSTCSVCGDQCWLSQYRLVMMFNWGDSMPSDIVACSGCGEILTEK